MTSERIDSDEGASTQARIQLQYWPSAERLLRAERRRR